MKLVTLSLPVSLALAFACSSAAPSATRLAAGARSGLESVSIIARGME